MHAGPALYALDLTLAGTPDGLSAWLDHAAGLGFDAVLAPLPFTVPEGEPDALLDDADALHPALDGWAAQGRTRRSLPSIVARLAEEARQRGMTLLLDLVLDRVAAGSSACREAGALFRVPEPGSVLDPRRPIETGNAASATAATPADAEALASWWARQAIPLTEAGVDGFRLLGLARLPAATLRPLIATLRRALPGRKLIGWMPGIAWDALAGLAGAGLDHAVPSLPWWDWRSEWLWQELALLRAVAPLLACPGLPGLPPPPHVSHDPALRSRWLRRSVAFAAGLAPGWMLPMGMEFGLDEVARRRPAMPAGLRGGLDLSADVAALNAARRGSPALALHGEMRLLGGAGGPVVAVMRADQADARRAGRAALVLANADLLHRQMPDASRLLAAAGGNFAAFQPLAGGTAELAPGQAAGLAPGEVRLLAGTAVASSGRAAALDPAVARLAAEQPRIAIEDVTPRVEGGRFAVKRIIGEVVTVEADIICDGHDQLGVVLQWRAPGETAWQEARMRPLGNDRWQASFPLARLGTHHFTVMAWRDDFATFRDELGKKHQAGVATKLELEEGRLKVEKAAAAAPGAAKDGAAKGAVRAALEELLQTLSAAPDDAKREALLSDRVAALMAEADPRPFGVRLEPSLLVEADRTAAQFASWYELFPRSMSDDPHRHGTFDDVIRHLPRVRSMGFDVLYFPPIHPIGHSNRKGRNNTLTPAPDDPGSPYAIGSEEGGHDAIHRQLGTLADFRRLIAAAAEHGLEVALDFAIQCSPDHPWLRAHKDWFDWRPDGSLRYAENPPKKYQDIVNVDFYAPGAAPSLWLALCNVVLFWAEQGVRIFRVDNPHTKPLPFWQWMIAEVRARHPDTLFLAEAFTRPKVMNRLAKVGFTQSYTYFTWRNTKRELTEYLTELTTTAPRDFFRPNFFVNTPDINPVFLQTSGRPGFLIRAALAATLSGLWGAYSGFELCEGRPLPGREEYTESEKYEIKAWDWDRPGNIRAEIAQLNRIRALNPALQTHLGITFLNAWNDAILCYEKATPDRSNVLVVAVSLDPYNPQEADFELPLWHWNLPDSAALETEDLLGGSLLTWTGKIQHLRLTQDLPYAIWRVRPAT